MAAIIIILILMLFGAVYFFQAQQRVRARDVVPYIPGDATTTDYSSGSTTVIDIVATTTIR